MSWDWKQRHVNLGLQNEALAGGRRALCSIHIFLFLFLTLPSFFPHLFFWWNCLHGSIEKQVGGLIQMAKKRGKKWGKVSAIVGFCFQMDLISSVVFYHVATHTHRLWGWYIVEQLEFSWHWRWSHKPCYPDTKGVATTELRKCASELTLFPASKDKLHWFPWRSVWQQRATIWWRADPCWSSSCCVWNSANKRDRAKNVLETGL